MQFLSSLTLRRISSFLAVFSFCLFSSLQPLAAQFRGSFQGTVTDATGAVVPGATVTLTSVDTSNSRTATTTGSGTYAFPSLAPGRYTFKVDKTGFNTQIVNNVSLTSEQAQGQDIQLQVATQTAQTVTVNANESPAIDTENANVAATFSHRELQALPTFGRDTYQVAALAPGAFGDNARAGNGGGSQNLPGSAGPGGSSGSSSIFQTENQVQVVANGTRNNSNNFQVDGVSTNSLAWGGAAVITPNKESVKEVTVESNHYSAENGRNSGAQVLLVSQNGTNQFHGSALMKFDRPGLNAFQRWNGPDNGTVQRDTDRFNQWAGSLGGPVIKNHLFFFFSYETLRNASTSTSLGWYETPQFLKGAGAANSIASKILSYPGEGASYNAIVPRTCADAGFSNGCNAIVQGGQYMGLDIGSPLKAPLGTPDPTYVSSGAPGVGGGLDGVPDLMFVQTTNPTNSVSQQYNGRVDYQATNKDLLTFSLYWVPVTSSFFNGPTRAANAWNSNRLNYSEAAVWNHTFSATWLNEARFNITRWYFNEIQTNAQEPFGLPQDNIDNLGTSNFQFFGAPGPGVFYQTTYNVRDTVSTVQGSHSLKAGVDIYKEQDNDTQAGGGRPTYNFHNLWDFANDAPYQENGNFDPITGIPTAATHYIRSAIYAGFIQDDWKPRPNLTLNLGMRWEYYSPITEKYGNISNFILGPGQNALTDLRLKVGGNLYNSSTNNWAPQLGFAWRPNPDSQRFVVRGGFGIGYNRMEEAITLNGRSNPPLVTSSSFNTPQTILYQVPSNVNQFYNWPINPNAKLAFSPTSGLPLTGSSLDLYGIQYNLPTPLTYRDSIEGQYDLGGNWVATLGYQGSLSRHLTRTQNLNLNFYPSVNPQIAHTYFYSNDVNASYNALLTELEHRFNKNFQLDFQYRWSHTLDDGSNDYTIGEYPYGISYLKGSSDFDVRHNVKLYGVYTPTIFKGHGWMRKLVGGWQISGILNWHTGYPWSPIYNAIPGNNLVYPNSGYSSLRPAGSTGGFGTDTSNSTFQRANGNFPNGALSYFSIPALSETNPTVPVGTPPPPGVGRNSLRGPMYFDTDMTLQKSFTLPKLPIFGENARLEFRGDLYNIFNKLNLSPLSNGTSSGPSPSQIIGSGTTSNTSFGQAQSALGARVVELQMRFSF